MAWKYAQFINCSDKQGSRPCGVCPSCHKIARLIHPDLHFSFPVNRSKVRPSVKNMICDEYMDLWRRAFLQNPYMTEQQWYHTLEIDNKSGIVSVAEAESLMRKLQFRALEASYKILILWLPERMHEAAANKLLKLIEEPPQGTYFFLVTENPQRILPTIRSRCLNLWVPPLKTEEEERFYGQTDNPSFAPLFDRLMEYCMRFMPYSLVTWSEQLAAMDKEVQKAFVLFSIERIRACLMLSLGQDALAFLKEDPARFRTWASRLPSGFYEAAYACCNRALLELDRNVNAKSIFCTLAFDFSYLCKKS